MRLTTRSTKRFRRPGRVSTKPNSTIQLDLDPRDVALTQQPRRAGDDAAAGRLRRPGRARLGARPDLPRLGLSPATSPPSTSPGKFLVRELGTDSVLIVGGQDGTPRAFLNVCRHRGARIVEETEGQVRKRLRCPYHAWSYDLNGELRAAPHMDGVEDFDFACNGLLGVRLAVVGGLVLIDLSGVAPDPDEHVGELLDHLDRYRLTELAARRRGHLRGGRELEGHRRELQRVPALPGRAPRAQRAQRLHERRRGDRRGRLVRRLDDPARGRLDDGARGCGPHHGPAADRRPHRRAGEDRPVLRRSSRTRSSRCTPTT